MFTSSFFDSKYINGEYDRKYSATDFANYFSSFVSNGVFANPGSGMLVSANDPNNMFITIKAGMAFINGYFCKNDSDYLMAVDPADGVLGRVDLVVLRWDSEKREIMPHIKKGSFSSTPAAPALERTESIYELGLAEINIPAGLVSIPQSNITDLRPDPLYCGWVVNAVTEIDASGWLPVFEASFQAWFDEVKGQLGDDPAGNLQNQINDIKTLTGTTPPTTSTAGTVGQFYLDTVTKAYYKCVSANVGMYVWEPVLPDTLQNIGMVDTGGEYKGFRSALNVFFVNEDSLFYAKDVTILTPDQKNAVVLVGDVLYKLNLDTGRSTSINLAASNLGLLGVTNDCAILSNNSTREFIVYTLTENGFTLRFTISQPALEQYATGRTVWNSAVFVSSNLFGVLYQDYNTNIQRVRAVVINLDTGALSQKTNVYNAEIQANHRRYTSILQVGNMMYGYTNSTPNPLILNLETLQITNAANWDGRVVASVAFSTEKNVIVELSDTNLYNSSPTNLAVLSNVSFSAGSAAKKLRTFSGRWFVGATTPDTPVNGCLEIDPTTGQLFSPEKYYGVLQDGLAVIPSNTTNRGGLLVHTVGSSIYSGYYIRQNLLSNFLMGEAKQVGAF